MVWDKVGLGHDTETARGHYVWRRREEVSLDPATERLPRFLGASNVVERCSWVTLSLLLTFGPALVGESQSVFRYPAVEERDWDAVFTRDEGWTGADVANSINLGDGRTLWLFGDTWVGTVSGGKHGPGSSMVNNSIAIHRQRASAAWQPPSPDSIKFLWGPRNDEDKPTAWIHPDPRRVKAHGDESEGENPNGWFWLTRDGIVAPDATGGPRLVLLIAHVGKRAGDLGAWGFKGVGGALAIISNPHDPVRRWRVEQFDNPHDIDVDTAAADPGLREIQWGVAIHFEPAKECPGGGYLYIYGVKETNRWNKQLVLARAPCGFVERFDTWQFFTGDNNWSPSLREARPIADHVVNEFSVDRVTLGGRTKLVMVHSEEVFGSRIMLRTADRAEGPWSNPVPVYRVQGVSKNKKYFTYGAKAHAHLSRESELLISYLINANDLWTMAADADIYRPRFIRLDLDALPEPGD